MSLESLRAVSLSVEVSGAGLAVVKACPHSQTAVSDGIRAVHVGQILKKMPATVHAFKGYQDRKSIGNGLNYP